MHIEETNPNSMRDERGSLESHSALAGRDDPANSSFYRREQKSQEMKGPSEAPQQAETSQDWNQVPPAHPVCSPMPPEVAWGTLRPRSTSPLPGTRRPRNKQKAVVGGQKSRQRLEPRTSLSCSSWSSVTLAGSVKSFSLSAHPESRDKTLLLES